MLTEIGEIFIGVKQKNFDGFAGESAQGSRGLVGPVYGFEINGFE